MTRKPTLLVLAPLVAIGLILGFTNCGRGPDGPSVLLVTLDTTRSDHLGCYGYQKNTSPRIDELATDGLRFDNAYAVASWTLPAHASLFTGKFPSSHGARYNPEGKINLVMEGGIEGNADWSAYRANSIAKTEITLAQIFTDAGYATKGIIGGPWMKGVFGLSKGFEDYDDSNFASQNGSELNGRPADDITRAAIEFLDAHADEAFFLFLNYYDPHSPYAIQSGIREFWEEEFFPGPNQNSWPWVIARYDAEIKYADAQFGKLLDHMREKGLYEDTWIILTADHGELMGEKDGSGRPMQGHGDSLSEPEIHIPLIVKEPGAERSKGANATFVQQIDIMPTLLDRLGLPQPPGMSGVSIYETGHPIVAEVYPLPFMNDARTKPWRQLGDWKVLIDGRWKFVWGGNGRHLLFDLAEDDDERHNLLASKPEIAEKMRSVLEGYFAELPEPGESIDVVMSDDLLEELRGLGYAGGDDDEVIDDGDEEQLDEAVDEPAEETSPEEAPTEEEAAQSEPGAEADDQ